MYDKYPFIPVSSSGGECICGWEAIGRALKQSAHRSRQTICVECYPGVFVEEVRAQLSRQLQPDMVIDSEELFEPASVLDRRFQAFLTSDPVFGVMNDTAIAGFFNREKLLAAQQRLAQMAAGTALVVGAGATVVCPQPDLLVYADMARWEIQQRQRRGEIGNLGANNREERPAEKYKRGFFIDWRAADRLKRQIWNQIDWVLDTNARAAPKMISAESMRAGLRMAISRPFRVVPFFDPGPWGGHWMEEVCGLPRDVPNHAWCFDCVPEENSLLLGFGDVRVEIPALNLVFAHPRELLGDDIYSRLGAEFPIRFDFLDTMGGGNLSLQVHPLTDYIRQHFGVAYTQDESYYLLDAAPDACVYLGLREHIEPRAMLADLAAAQAGGPPFDAGLYINKWPAKKHDHFLIPAGTVHCSGRNSMVLEISATPYIFTFKLWDWGRLGLDGRPRPIHLGHGVANIQWDRTTGWVKRALINRVETLAEGDGWREERTGLHELEFIETRRHWFTGRAPHDTGATVNVLNLVEGEEAVIESPNEAFEPFVVHYAETFIVPAQTGAYTIRPHGPAQGKQCATIKAFVRQQGSGANAATDGGEHGS